VQGQICEKGIGYQNKMWFEMLIQFFSSLHLVFYQEILSFSTLEKTTSYIFMDVHQNNDFQWTWGMPFIVIANTFCSSLG